MENAAGNILSVLYLAIYLTAGILLAQRVLPREGTVRTLPLGCAFGVAGLAMLPAAFGLVLGFGRAAAVAGALTAAAAAFAARKLPQKADSITSVLPQKMRETARRGVAKNNTRDAAHTALPQNTKKAVRCGEKPADTAHPARKDTACLLAVAVPGVVLTVWLLYTHVLCYSAADGAYYTGQSGYGDIAMHLAFIKSIAVQGRMPPAYPLLAGQALFGYPFLCESISSVFLVLGAGLKFAYLLPEVPALVSIFCFTWLLAREVLASAGKATAAAVLFFCGGGFGFCWFFTSAERFRSIFTGYYTTPMNDVAHNIRWVNSIADLLVPQRATLMGWALMLPCLYLLYRFAFRGESRLWLPLGLLAGCLPLMQTHSLLALVLFSAVWLVQPAVQAVRQKSLRPLAPWLGYAAVAGALCLPQLFGVIFRQTGGGRHFLRFEFNWVNHDTGENYFWFYIKNLGLLYLVQIPAFFRAKRPLRRFYLGGLAVLTVSECIVFQPNDYDNIKLLYFWFLAACILAADALWDWLAKIPVRPVRALTAAAVIFVCTVSGVLTLGREVVGRYQVFSAADAAAAEYVDANAPAEALFLTGMQHLNPVASLAGRSIVCGSTLYVYYHGMDYEAQQAAVRALYEVPSEELLAQWGVDYVYFSGWERSDYAVDEAWYAARYPVWYQSESCIIYQITEVQDDTNG